MGKIALVTGASRGIGYAIATKFAEMGYDLALNYRSNDSEANKVKETLEKLGYFHLYLLKGFTYFLNNFFGFIIKRFYNIFCWLSFMNHTCYLSSH